MAFVREKISQEDFENYHLNRYGERISGSVRPGVAWAIDREKNIYLSTISSGGREPENHNTQEFLFHIDGDTYSITMSFELKEIKTKHWSLSWHKKECYFLKRYSLSENEKDSSECINIYFKNAMRVYRLFNIDSSYDAEIDISFYF